MSDDYRQEIHLQFGSSIRHWVEQLYRYTYRTASHWSCLHQAIIAALMTLNSPSRLLTERLIKNPALFNSDCVDQVITTASVTLSRAGRKCESSTGNAPPARNPGCADNRSPHHRSSVHGYASELVRKLVSDASTQFYFHRAVFGFCGTPSSHLNVSTNNRATSAILVHRQCPCGSTVSTEVTDYIGRR